MGTWELDLWLTETALSARVPAVASSLVAMTQFVEAPSLETAQRIVCQLDCASEDESCDAATRAICALLARCWLYGPDAAACDWRGSFRAKA